MKFQSALLSSASGSISGATFTSFRNVNVIRKKVGPREHISSFTQLRKQQQKLIAVQWKGLSEVTRQQWQNLALQISKTNSFGQSYHQSGFNLFRERAFNARLVNVTTPILPLPNVVLNGSPWMQVAGSGATQRISRVSGYPLTGVWALFYVARQTDTYRNPSALNYRFANFFNAETTFTLTVNSLYAVARFPYSKSRLSYIKIVFVSKTTYQRKNPPQFLLLNAE